MNIPAKLKLADIARFQTRGGQLEKLKPPMAYWCYYWIVNQILAKGLHEVDDECKAYTTDLIEKLEQMKTEYASDDAIVDDLAGQAYVEKFGSETFQRADNAVRANKASKQTAETFQAAATFLDLVHIWGTPSQDVAAKIKYAKYHALRIAKAIKAGEDPNLTNPAPEAHGSRTHPIDLESTDSEVQDLNGKLRQPFVEEVPDEDDRLQAHLATESTQDQYLHPSLASSIPRPEESTALSGRSPGDGYFPSVTSNSPSDGNVTMLGGEATSPSPTTPSVPPDLMVPSNPQSFYAETHDMPSPLPAPATPSAAPFQGKAYGQLPAPYSQPQRQSTAPHANHKPISGSRDTQNFLNDDVAVLEAQKHAKWAISALNFEDVPTAVKELRLALTALGG